MAQATWRARLVPTQLRASALLLALALVLRFASIPLPTGASTPGTGFTAGPSPLLHTAPHLSLEGAAAALDTDGDGVPNILLAGLLATLILPAAVRRPVLATGKRLSGHATPPPRLPPRP